MNAIIVIKKTTTVRTANFSIKEKRLVIAVSDNKRIKVIHKSICQNHCI